MTLLSRSEWFKAMGISAGATALAMASREAMAGEAAAPPPAEPAKGGEVYTLPPLPYPADALEPHISKEIITIHHDRHHAGYVKNLNETIVKLNEARQKNDFANIQALCHKLAFNGSGHWLHTLYWMSLAPKPHMPDKTFLKAIDDNFGSFDALKAELKNATLTVDGSGWGGLVLEPMQRKMFVVQVEDHEDQYFVGAIPLLIIDAWEHAYYLQYENRRAEYLDAVIKNIVDWDGAGKRYHMMIKAIDDAHQQAEKAAAPKAAK